ncbi:MAG TPA: GIY-YIG nuclease family protein [Bacteroidales bacterium]|nr:GIY-YIG nuclease family protein [Bacteroidales bacterium]
MYKGGYVYIMTNRNHTVLYTGVTEDIIKRVREHKDHKFEGFTKKYNVVILVYYQFYSSIQEAIEKEKIIKGGSWQRKFDLIEDMNPEWEDLYEKIAF